MGVPGLKGYDKQRVERDNEECEFTLAECELMNDRGAGSLRENPNRSIHWVTPTEVRMFATG